MQKSSRFVISLGLAAAASFIFLTSGCDAPAGGGKGDVAATVNGKPIMKEQVERLLKQQGGGQEATLSPLQLAQARLQILDNLIQTEVMYQKAEKEKTVPSDDDVTAEYNKQKTAYNLSAEQFDKKMQEIGETEASAKDSIKKGLAIENLMKKVTSKVDPPKDAEVEEFYNTNKDMFIKKRGVKLATIVVDPTNSGAGDTTVDDASAKLKLSEITQKLQQGNGTNFSEVARETSEDPSRLQGGELEYFPEDVLRQNFPQVADHFMDPKVDIGNITGTQMGSKYYFFKLLERTPADETGTLDKPGTREKATVTLVQARKNLLQASYMAVAMNEAKIENLLAKQVVDNPNNLSGARPAQAAGSPSPEPSAPAPAANSANTGVAPIKPANSSKPAVK